ncbi:MAG TPA: C40 family peptidase [Thermomicrobiales bacterium]|nr:C40 family peptidase [Thermomicrobiales bacterium]
MGAARRSARIAPRATWRRVRRAVGTALASGALLVSAAHTPALDNGALRRAATGDVAAAAVDHAPGGVTAPLAGRVAFVGGAVARPASGRDFQPAAADAAATTNEARPARRKKATPAADSAADAPTEAAETPPETPTETPTADAASAATDVAPAETPDASATKKANKANKETPPAAAVEEPAASGTPAADQAAPTPPPTPPPAPTEVLLAAADPAAASTAVPDELSPAAAPGPAPTATVPAPAPTNPAPAPTESAAPNDTASPTVIDTGWIVGSFGADCHAAMDIGSPVLAVFPEGAVVDVIGRTIGDWQPVLCNGSPGYLRASSISWWPPAPAAAATPAAGAAHAGATPPALAAAAAPGKDDGAHVVNFALQYVGYPYVNAAEGPNAFDCSGFTMFVIQHALGLDITHDMFVQYDMGTKIDRNDLQPGDLVFFQNTDRAGLSHVGIYIGNGQFVDAENEQAGVVVSDLNADYYASRWYGAVRYP